MLRRFQNKMRKFRLFSNKEPSTKGKKIRKDITTILEKIKVLFYLGIKTYILFNFLHKIYDQVT